MTDPDGGKYCGYSCSGEMEELKEILTRLKEFSKINPEHAAKVATNMTTECAQAYTEITLAKLRKR